MLVQTRRFGVAEAQFGKASALGSRLSRFYPFPVGRLLPPARGGELRVVGALKKILRFIKGAALDGFPRIGVQPRHGRIGCLKRAQPLKNIMQPTYRCRQFDG